MTFVDTVFDAHHHISLSRLFSTVAILIVYAIIGFNIVVAFIEQAPVYGWFYGM
jgi:hypothetical protein